MKKRYDDNEVTQHSQKFPFEIVPSPKNPEIPAYKIETMPLSEDKNEVTEIETIIKHFTVTEITSRFLSKLKLTAEGYVGKNVNGCVLSVPIHLVDDAKIQLVTAARIAGFTDVYTMHEPVAAALAFETKSKSAVANSDAIKSSDGGVGGLIGSIESDKKDKMVLVLDLGAHQLNATLLRSSDGIFSILDSDDEFGLGGAQFDEVLVKYCVTEFKRKSKMDISESRRSMIKLRAGCETTKKTLSRTDVAPCSIESLYDGMDFNITINRGRFEMLAEPLFLKCKEVVRNVLKKTSVDASEVDEVLLVGGSSRIPRFQAVIKSMFTNGKTSINSNVEPDEAIALGCAIQAGIISTSPNIDYSSAADDVTLLSARYLKKSIGIEVADGQLTVLIPQRTPIPVKRTIEFSNSEDDQKECFLAVYEGDSNTAKENTLLAEIVLGEIPSAKSGTSKIQVSFIVEKDGILNIIAGESTSNRTMRVKLDHISS
ncbi:70-kilodalton heat shock protein [Nowakowskiella sp. JEL0078]|nr:70-kilodalton heat shock protein [Nowakowskiella sp. JEL0078]